jgi:hypothetical protein
VRTYNSEIDQVSQIQIPIPPLRCHEFLYCCECIGIVTSINARMDIGKDNPPLDVILL